MNGFLSPRTTIASLKEQARRLRTELAHEGVAISHSKSLEILSGQLGYKNWNTLRAVVGQSQSLSLTTIGTRVRGHYLGQAIEGEIVGVKALLASPGKYRVTLSFDNPVDVVTFNSFSNLRRLVSCIVDASGRATTRTSDGQPHLQLEAA